MDNQGLLDEIEIGGRAYIRNLIAAEEAIVRGQFNVAKILRAAAHSQRTVAMQAARMLDQDTDAAALFETILSETGDLDDAAQINEARASLRVVLQRAIESLQSNPDVLESDVAQMVWGCFNCGTIVEGDQPHTCPTCGALSVEFQSFGPFYLQTAEHLGQLKPAEIVSILEAIPDQVESVTRGVDDATLRRKPSPEEWCVKEIIAHMLETDRLFYQRVRVVLESQGTPELPRPMPPWKLHEGKGYEDMPIEDILHLMRQVRSESLDLARDLSAQEWTRSGTQGGVARPLLALGTWLANHDRGHLAQINNLLKS